MPDKSTALVPSRALDAQLVQHTPSEYDGLVMAVAPAEALKRMQELQAFVKTVMREGVDYGVIPGTGIKKPSLYQPGAQKLAEIYGFSVTFEDNGSVLDWREPFFFFRKVCVLRSRRDGGFVCTGLGSCNSKEDRYAWRWAWPREVPNGMDKKALKTKGDADHLQYRIPNEDIYSLVNSMEKIAAKRALVHAVTNATRSSGIFTQDVEDLPPEAFGAAEDHRSWSTQAPDGNGEKANGKRTPVEPPAKRKWAVKQRCLGDDGERWVGILECVSREDAITKAPTTWPAMHSKDWTWEAHDFAKLTDGDRNSLHLAIVYWIEISIQRARKPEDFRPLREPFGYLPKTMKDSVRAKWEAQLAAIKAGDLGDPEPEPRQPEGDEAPAE